MRTLEKAFLEKYPDNGIVAEKWLIATGTPFVWDSLTKPAMNDFCDYLCSNMAQSSARQYTAKLKAVIEIYADEINLPREWRKSLTIKNDESQHVYLTEDEIRRIIAYEPEDYNEAAIQQQFILGCLTGARHSDYSRFTRANVNDRGNLVYVSKKTHVKAELPLSNVARDILFATGRRFCGAYRKVLSDPTFNITIRNICKKCGITQEVQLYRRGDFWNGKKYEAVSSHTSRRSFATNLYIRCRDIMLVSKLCGHSSISMTERYICVGMESMTECAMKYFECF